MTLIQSYTSTLVFDVETGRLAKILGWEPANELTDLEDYLGSTRVKVDYREVLNRMECPGIKAPNLLHSFGGSGLLQIYVLKMLAAYSAINPLLELADFSSNVTSLLSEMVQGANSTYDVDLSLTWGTIAASFPTLLEVPAFIGGVVPLVNLGDSNVTVTLSVPILAAIFMGEITRWDDARLQSLNPNVTLPAQDISVLVAPIAQTDGASALFAGLLKAASPGFSWPTNFTTDAEQNLAHLAGFTPYSLSYGFGDGIQLDSVAPANLLGSTNQTITLSNNSLSACWLSMTHPECWPLAVRLSLVVRPAARGITCAHKKVAVDFLSWVMKSDFALDDLIVPNLDPFESMGTAIEFCNGRSLLVTMPEPQVLNEITTFIVEVICAVGLVWSMCQVMALAVARNQSELKSASVFFSLLAVIGVFLILIAPLLIVQRHLTVSQCSAALWLSVLGFSLTYGAIFAKLFRLYKIFTSRSFVVGRLADRQLFLFVLAFLVLDFILLLIYSILTPPHPDAFSA